MKNFWHIECTRHKKILFQEKVDVKYLSEKNLNEFIHTLLCKYTLTDEEILEQFKRVPFAKKINYIAIHRTSNLLGEPLEINFLAQIADTCVSVWLKE